MRIKTIAVCHQFRSYVHSRHAASHFSAPRLILVLRRLRPSAGQTSRPVDPKNFHWTNARACPKWTYGAKLRCCQLRTATAKCRCFPMLKNRRGLAHPAQKIGFCALTAKNAGRQMTISQGLAVGRLPTDRRSMATSCPRITWRVVSAKTITMMRCRGTMTPVADGRAASTRSSGFCCRRHQTTCFLLPKDTKATR